MPKPSGWQSCFEHPKGTGVAAIRHRIEPRPPTGIDCSGLHECIHRLERMTAGPLSVRLIIEEATTGDQSLQPSSPQTNGHKITQTHAKAETVAIAECTTVSAGLQPDVNDGDRLFGEHAGR